LAPTVALPVIVNLQLRVLFPPLEQAPDQTTSRPLVALKVIDEPAGNEAAPVLPTGTLMPAGLDVTRSPLRPLAVSVRIAVCAGGVTLRMAVRVTPAALAVIVTEVAALTAVVAMAKLALLAPGATDTLPGGVAALPLLDKATANPPSGAAAESVTLPCEVAPPVTLAGLTDNAESAAGPAAGSTARVALRVASP
jgi:hypothetical protein